MVVLQVAANTEVKQSETSDKAALRRAIMSCNGAGFAHAAHARRSRWPSRSCAIAARTATRKSICSATARCRTLDEFDNKALPLIYHRVGQGANNLGITALDVRANPEDASQRAIYVSVANFSTNTLETDLELRLDGQLVETAHRQDRAGRSFAAGVSRGADERRRFHRAFDARRTTWRRTTRRPSSACCRIR